VTISEPKNIKKTHTVHLNKSIHITKLFETHSCSLQAKGGHKINVDGQPDKALEDG
jgi:hypothetical protein